MITELELPAIFQDELYPAIDLEIDSAVDRLDDSLGLTKKVLHQFLEVRRTKQVMRAVPLLIFGALTGDLRPAVPIAAVNILWYTAGRLIDNTTDGAVEEASAGLDVAEAMMAAILCLHSVPAEIIARLDLPASTLSLLAADLSYGSTSGVEGQLREFRATPETVRPVEVLRCYRRKTGGGYAMAGAMAARLAGADQPVAERWRDFGFTFGSLRQLRNDQEDLATGREEDLRNQVLTFLFASVLTRSTGLDRGRLLALRAQAPLSAQARGQLRELLLTTENVCLYVQEIEKVRARAHGLLDSFGDRAPWLARLRDFVDVSARPLPLFQQILGQS
ncbi:polyprenyl synthetase family protein [Fodinicola feengrottensis]|uniref:Polyprenyl synthetase family protein n=1 Tax=Fodinicola feengrottensis TaxID=435914 RepID=A0ABP4V7T0_9ACTN|nr:polyprenyl synthetase family protein [Fodinicola feengrottensis]